MRPGARVRVASQPPHYSAFDRWIGTVEGEYGSTRLVKLDRYPIPLPFAESELRPLAVATAHVGAHFPEYGAPR